MNFTCSANANPAVDNYTLFENSSVVNTSSLGVWSITRNTAGQFVYRCEANNSVGSEKSSDVTFNVEGELRTLCYRSYDSGFIAYSKISTLKSGFKKLRIRVPDSPDVWTKALSEKKKLRTQKYPDTCGQG